MPAAIRQEKAGGDENDNGGTEVAEGTWSNVPHVYAIGCPSLLILVLLSH